jgi:hypothetical protein
MRYNYATDVAAGACPGCGQAVILYHHVRLTSGEERREITRLDTVFCRQCVETMYEADPKVAVSLRETKHVSSAAADDYS